MNTARWCYRITRLAGEAMDAKGRNGTVEGAIASGLRAAG